MTDVHDVLAVVESSEEFRRFAKDAPGSVLVHVFSHRKNGKGEVEVGYYDGARELITVFSTEPVAAREPEEVFKAGDLHALAHDRVRVGLAGACALIRAHIDGKHPGHPVEQEILILQQREQPVWNATVITGTLHIMHVRIDAETGEFLHEEFQNVLNLRG